MYAEIMEKGQEMSENHNLTAESGREDLQLISPQEGATRAANGALLIDVRRLERRVENGVIAEAVVVDRTAVREVFGPDSTQSLTGPQGHEKEIIVFCSSENGSRPVVEKLSEFGYRNVFHIAGGFTAWKAAGLPVEDFPAR
ncbi:rhodanese-like domain-containing protein [Rhizobium puerariae]|uniref:Rhodanese-like domain-containing protein n=1 Tax=Rhizobium puerariae TaxID=1585791 RepID=A0ABV6ADK7_9HYPH